MATLRPSIATQFEAEQDYWIDPTSRYYRELYVPPEILKAAEEYNDRLPPSYPYWYYRLPRKS